MNSFILFATRVMLALFDAGHNARNWCSHSELDTAQHLGLVVNFEADLQQGSVRARERHGERLPRWVREALCETAEPPGPGGPGRGGGVCTSLGGGGRGASESAAWETLCAVHSPTWETAGRFREEGGVGNVGKWGCRGEWVRPQGLGWPCSHAVGNHAGVQARGAHRHTGHPEAASGSTGSVDQTVGADCSWRTSAEKGNKQD